MGEGKRRSLLRASHAVRLVDEAGVDLGRRHVAGLLALELDAVVAIALAAEDGDPECGVAADEKGHGLGARVRDRVGHADPVALELVTRDEAEGEGVLGEGLLVALEDQRDRAVVLLAERELVLAGEAVSWELDLLA